MCQEVGIISAVSKYIIPFYLNRKRVKKNNVFSQECWKNYIPRTKYLTRYIQEIFESVECPICQVFQLKPECRSLYGLPAENVKISLDSQTIANASEIYTFRLVDVSVYYYATGIGFLVLTIKHNDEEVYKQIVDKSFAFVNIFLGDNDRKSTVRFFYEENDNKYEFSLKNTINDLLMVKELEKNIELFPTNKRKRMNGFHRVYLENLHQDDSKLTSFLCKGLHSSAIATSNEQEDAGKVHYSTTDNMSWDICSNGVVFMAYKNQENDEFLRNVYAQNIENEYFLLYLFGLHERENLHRYNYRVVKEWNNPKKLVQIKNELIKFNVWSGYNTVSTEMAYQKFYTDLCKMLEIDNLEKDVSEIVIKLNNAVAEEKEKRINSLLTAITILAIFSALADSVAFVDRLYSGESFSMGHDIVIGIIIMILAIGVLNILRKRK